MFLVVRSGRSWMLGNETWKTGRRGRWGSNLQIDQRLTQICTIALFALAHLHCEHYSLFQCPTQICNASALFVIFFTTLDFLWNKCTNGIVFITTGVPKIMWDSLGSQREGTLLMFQNMKSLFKFKSYVSELWSFRNIRAENGYTFGALKLWLFLIRILDVGTQFVVIMIFSHMLLYLCVPRGWLVDAGGAGI